MSNRIIFVGETMIYFTAAHYKEAAPFITRYKMKKQVQNSRFDVFKSNGKGEGKGREASLIISGEGMARASAAAAYILTLYPFSDGDLVVNIGFCGGLENGAGVLLCNKLTDYSTGKRFYPCVLKKHPFFESGFEERETEGETEKEAEAVCFYQAALMFAPSERVIVLRIATEKQEVEKQEVEKQEIEKQEAEDIARWLDGYDGLDELPLFSHIYIENGAEDYELTRKITGMYPQSVVIGIKHYKDVFSPKNQDFSVRKLSRKLILAVKKNGFLYEGSDLCDSFGNENFYYTGDVLNCVYDCGYCYLQGMYDCAYITVFVNIESTFAFAEGLLSQKPLYICVSYNTDLLALENITGYVREWLLFAEKHSGLSLEIRTKSANFRSVSDIEVNENVVFAWTVSPEEIIRKFEGKTPPLLSRLRAAREAIDRGWKVRICIDPVLRVEGFEELYAELDEVIKEYIDVERLYSISYGSFRAPEKYFKKMKKLNRDSNIYNAEFVNEGGYIKYSGEV